MDLRVEWANEVVCATWEEIREEVERAEAEALLLADRGIGRSTGTDPGWVCVRGVGRLIDDQGHPINGLARNLWAHSPKTRGEYSCPSYFITPINRLPFELLHQIILIIIIEEMGGPPLVLMHVTHVSIMIPPRFKGSWH